jgi:hypothetical protein
MLPPLAGEKCVTCGELIASYSEGSFCAECGNAAHNACQRPEGTGVADGKCARCGGDPQWPLAVEVRRERNQSWTAAGTTPAALQTSTEEGAAAFSFVSALVWALRIMAGACAIVLIYQIVAIDEAATKAEKAAPVPEMKDGEFKMSEPTRPSTGGPMLMAVLYCVAAAVVLLALAEILRLHVELLRKIDGLQEDEFDDDDMAPAAPPA